jgi:hypothetical protein
MLAAAARQQNPTTLLLLAGYDAGGGDGAKKTPLHFWRPQCGRRCLLVVYSLRELGTEGRVIGVTVHRLHELKVALLECLPPEVRREHDVPEGRPMRKICRWYCCGSSHIVAASESC